MASVRLGVLLLLLASGCTREEPQGSGDRRAPRGGDASGQRDAASATKRDAASETKRDADSPAASQRGNPLCRALEGRGRMLDLAAASYGALFVHALGGGPSALDDARAVAVKHGAKAAYVATVTPLYVLAGDRLLDRVGLALPKDAAPFVMPFLAEGRLPAEDAAEVVLTIDDAAVTGAKVGDGVRLRSDPLEPSLPVREATIVGFIDSTDATVAGMGQHSLWVSPSLMDDGASRFLTVQLPADEDVAAWTERFADAVGPDSKPTTFEELQAPILSWRRDVRGLCGEARPPAREHAPLRQPALPCSIRASWDEDTTGVHSLWGEEQLAHRDFVAPADWPPVADDVRIEPMSAFEVVFIDPGWASGGGMYGWPPEALRRLAPHVQSGDLASVTPEGGMVVPQALAEAAGVRVGDRMRFGARPRPQTVEEAEARLVMNEVEVAAIVRLPPRIRQLTDSVVWVHRDFQAHPGAKAGTTNAAMAWGSVAAVATYAIENDAVSQRPEAADIAQADRHLRAALDALCDPAPSAPEPSPGSP